MTLTASELTTTAVKPSCGCQPTSMTLTAPDVLTTAVNASCGCDHKYDMTANGSRDTAWVLVKPDGLSLDMLAEIDISPGDLHDHGREDEPHITVFGFIKAGFNHDNEAGEGEKNSQAVASIVANKSPFFVELVGLDLFELPEYDVLMFRVRSPELDALHTEIRTAVSHEWPHDVYSPHLTVAYLKPGTGQAYVDKTELDGRVFRISEVIYRSPNFEEPRVDDSAMYDRYEAVHVLSESNASPQAPTPNHILINLAITVNAGMGKRVTKHGRDYLVVPYVGVVEGVMNGKLILMEEVKRAGLLWDDSPVVVDHPKQGGGYISSKSPDVPKIGRVYNSYVKDDRLMGELWVDIEAAKANTGGVSALNRLERGETMEVSWGWWQAPEKARGEFKGNAYDTISRNLIPDHLAILLNDPGACSVADGCGTYRVNETDVLLQTNGCTCATHGGQTPTEVHMSDELDTRDGSDVEEVPQVDTTETTEPALGTAVVVEVEVEEVAEVEAEVSTNAAEFDFDAMRREIQELKATVGSLQANAEQAKRQERSARISRLAANEACPFDANELRDFTDAQLQKFEAKYRTADLSARGGFGGYTANRQAFEPLSAPSVLLEPVKAGKEA